MASFSEWIGAAWQHVRKNPSTVLKTIICGPLKIVELVKTARPGLSAASKGSRALIPLTLTISAFCVLAAENKIEELANQVCSLALGSAGAAIGGAIGGLGGPIGMVIGAIVGGIAGGVLGEYGWGEFRKWLFTEGEDGVRPIDKIADKLKAATDKLRILTEVSSIIIHGHKAVFGALLKNWRGMGGLGEGSG
ncbi:unnamed protein product [Tuber aestivum]|uniref:Glycine zipper domain-containing protein n=1 Tax=Tuber aestivum TaxID=59557 RepID=A0A292PZ55_9PEZI|nr:unnamed protein product [Tuber aestivum]